ncbi:MAG: TIR domain-containing protein [Opitutae bacterium]|nr:TIR domain-containing protein [Opitutae bacterium]
MSDSPKAVFLSYASQDAEAAKRICEALRAAGVEVWFDQSELVGGDAWDAKIRKQISECTLFVPIISANTQARLEGYFRLEWKIAAQRTHTMADERVFLLPIVIDTTRDTEARVPAEFKTVQWTRLPGGETPPAFCARVLKLLSGSGLEPGRPRPGHGTRGEVAVPPRKKSRLWLAPVLLGLFAGIAVVIRQPWRQNENPVRSVPPAVTLAPAATELARVRAQLTPDRWQREDFAAMAPTLDRLLEANPELADAWAMRSIINSLQVLRNYDSSTKPLETGKAAADRATRLAPGSPLADIATGMHLVAMTSRGGDARACRPYLDRGVAALPPDALTRYAELASYWFAYDFDQVQRCGEAWRAAEPQASFPPWIFAQLNVVRRRPAEAEQWAEIAKADPNITGVRAYFTAFESKYYLRADVPAAWEVLQKVPAAGRSVHRVVHARWLVAMADHRWDEALQELSQVPETFLFDRSYHGPKALLTGLAHQRAGRPDAAAAQFREAERLLREHLAADSDNEELHTVLAVTLACAGRGTEARNELALVEPLVKGRTPSIYRGSLVLTIAQAYAVLGDYRQLAPWLRKLLAEPSQFPFTPASLRLDPRFSGVIDAPEVQALLKEFAGLDQTAFAPTAADKSVAVLAFANLSDDKGNEYFSDGISEELLNVLAKVPGLKVSARTSARKACSCAWRQVRGPA